MARTKRTKISESIYQDAEVIIPLAEVQYLQKMPDGGIVVILSGTTWNPDLESWNNSAYIEPDRAEGFIRAWCFYRHEADGPFLPAAPRSPAAEKGPKGPDE